jgi:hypothetical protein
VTAAIQKTLSQNQRLSAELKNFVNRNKELNDCVKSLEGAMEKVLRAGVLIEVMVDDFSNRHR